MPLLVSKKSREGVTSLKPPTSDPCELDDLVTVFSLCAQKYTRTPETVKKRRDIELGIAMLALTCEVAHPPSDPS